MRKILTIAALGAALTLGGGVAAAAPALASDNANGATLYSGIQNDTCGGAQDQSPSLAVGFVNYHLSGTTMLVNIHLKGAPPDTTYTSIRLWEGFCAANQNTTDTITTNDNGVANATITFTGVPNPAPGGTYWVFLFTPSGSSFILANSVAVSP
jgi:hypothetical protein